MMQKIRKAVFPVAGLGTRFLPATKANPKEMLVIVDKPLIQYAVEEAIAAGITELIFITSKHKRAITDHFDKAGELENELRRQNKRAMLDIVRNILPDHVTCMYINQTEPLGLGHAILCARAAVGDEPFAVLLADDLIDDGSRGCLRQMVGAFDEYQASVVAVEEIPAADTRKYGIVDAEALSERIGKLRSIVEKPDPADAPSRQAVVGRYILTHEIFDALEQVDAGFGGEIQLTDAIADVLRRQEVYSFAFAGKRYDCGSKFGYLQAVVEFALKHPELKEDFSDYLAVLRERM